MKVLVGCERSGIVRDACRARGHDAVSCDLVPSARPGPHITGDIFDAIARGDWDALIAFPDCTYLTCSAEWAYGDGPYHQRVKPDTLVGAARRAARDLAIQFVDRLWRSPIPRKVIENPRGVLSTRWRKPTQVIQPWQFGDDASKATCLWLDGVPGLVPDPALYVPPRMVDGKPRWANQTDSGQNRLSPSADRAMLRAETYPGIAAAFAAQFLPTIEMVAT